jgi:NADPH-dependent curcumin reductase CurA
MLHAENRQWLLARRPQGRLSAADFTWTRSPIPEPRDGELLVRNLYLSCDPTQRSWIAGDTYLPRVKIGEVMRSIAVGEVIESRLSGFEPGQLVQGMFGWQDYCAAGPGGLFPVRHLPRGASIEASMSVLGLTGLTAYFGLLDVGAARAGETVVVSGAAGATGSIAGQIARIKGCRAVGIAGGEEKCRYLAGELGFDAAIDYKAENVAARLRQTCPHGIDVFFDNVGGRVLDLAILSLAHKGRVVICGGISSYDDVSGAEGPRNYMNLVARRARMEGFVVTDHFDRADQAIADLSAWVDQGELRYRVDVQHGLENAPGAVARLFDGHNRGKQLLKIADPLLGRPRE